MIWLNGRLVPREQARIDIADRGLLLGDGLFETLRVYRGHVFKLEDHLGRLARGAAELGIPLPLDVPDIASAVHETLEAHHLDAASAALRVTLTRGPGQRGLLPPEDPNPNLIISVSPYHPAATEGGFAVLTSKRARRNEGSLTARLKTLGYLDNIVAQAEAAAEGTDEALLLNNKGTIACGARSNLFAVIKGTLLTPTIEEGALPGITRATVLHLAKELAVQVTETRISHGDLAKAEEAFLTNSLLEIVPIRRFESWDVASGTVTRRLSEAYRALTPR
ncbi:aminotransferase class IV [Dongia deserti]|uniref:aminotransferase class IV n=1 Tax=Dongia deserti TaxID=2268030 RepID=UPI000E646C37|nr:aminotransferase class IV [Dongia deserti]